MDQQVNMKIVPIDISHANELSALAKAIYVEYYLHLWNPGGADWYMHEHAYPPDKLKTELADSNNQHVIVYDEEKAMGYVKLRLNAILPGFEKYNSLEIERIYLHRAIAGKGFGKKLMQLSEEIARNHKKEMIFLKAMDTSIDAISFYQKMGFTKCGTYVLPFPQMKEEYRGMVILNKFV
jgi:ribosomal protein S18 acetylase RimI-like enzyme